MIKVNVTKNIIRKTKSTLGLSMKQIIIALIAVFLGIILYVSLRNTVSLSALMWIIFIEMASIIMFGVVNIQGQSLMQYIIKIFKGVDIRPYDSKGVFSNDVFSEKNKK